MASESEVVVLSNAEIAQDEHRRQQEHVSHKTTSYGISIDASRIRAVPVEEQSTALRDLGIDVFDQDEFEEGVLKQVNEAIAVKETEAVIRGWEKELKAVNDDIRTTNLELEQVERIIKGLASPSLESYEARRHTESVKRQRNNKFRQLKKLEAKQKSLHHKFGIGDEEILKEDIGDENMHVEEEARIAVLEDRIEIMKKLEEERDKLIKTGQMTPFGSFINAASSSTIVEDAMVCKTDGSDTAIVKHASAFDAQANDDQERELKREQVVTKDDHFEANHLKATLPASSEEDNDSDNYVPEEDELRDSWYDGEDPHVARSGTKQIKMSTSKTKKARLNIQYVGDDAVLKQVKKTKRKDKFDYKPLDDGDDGVYYCRIRDVRIKALLKKQGLSNDDDEEELPDMEFDNKFKIPGCIWHNLYKYQQTGVKWLWELHCQQAGGIVGDEMGLGKTILTIAFLAGLKYSKISTKKSRGGLGPALIVCPVTVLHQWVREFHKWWPDFRVAVLHDTGSFQGTRDTLIRKICDANGVLVTSYSGVRMNQDRLLAQRWDYVILDEGHKIRNPDAEITLACKQMRTPHRLILSGSPMQNNLRELWSLFDFVFPGKLGTLPVFLTEFSVPITTGGYANASKLQVQTAYKCACVLRDTINPYLLRRLKKDVNMEVELPSKNEQVLFCRLSEEQRKLYEEYLDSREVQSILAGKYKVFPGLIMLRKICNHPDLTSQAGSLVKAKQDELNTEMGVAQAPDRDEGYGDWRRAGKMIVVEALLKMWKAQGHRVLLFSQTRQMLNILEGFVSSRGYAYRRMDGSTSISSRQPLVAKFNQDTSIFVFLLTTRVGGVGVNLTGADRVIIYDPDWNPSTDTQARERSWRIGQTREVTIYRLLNTGTIEEKIYHRQIFKQFLTNRVLKDPKQRRFFKTNDLYELFTLDDSYKNQGTETSAIFAGTNCEVKVSGARKRRRDPRVEARAVTKTKRDKMPATKHKRKERVRAQRSVVEDDGGAFSIDSRDIEEVKKQKAVGVSSEAVLVEVEVASAVNTEGNSRPNSQEGSSNACAGNTGADGDHDTNTSVGSSIGSSVAVGSADVGSNVGSSTAVGSADVGSNVGSSSAIDSADVGSHLGSGVGSSIQKQTLQTTSDSEKRECSPSKHISNVSLSSRQTSDRTKQDIRARSETSTGSNSMSRPGSSRTKHQSNEPKHGKKRKLSSLTDKELRKKLRIKEKKKRRKREKLEGQEIDNLDYHEVYSAVSSTNEMGEGKHDDAILKTLFKKSGVHSALQHDVIMESGNPDYTLVENEANRVAQQAVQALKNSRQRCLRAVSGIPTWTGTSGSSGLSDTPRPRLRFGKRSTSTTVIAVSEESKSSKRAEDKPLFSGALMGMQSAEGDDDSDPVSSNHLLAKMRARNNILPSEEPGNSTQAPETEHDELIAEMSNFVASQGHVPGQVSTQEIVDRFRHKLPRENSAVFRAMLKRICEFSRDSTKEGVWRLKPEFS